MDFSHSAEDLAFGDRLRAWIGRELDNEWSKKYRRGSAEYVSFGKEWERTLYRGGWGGVFWPAEYGGLDASPSQRVVFAQTMAEAKAPEGMGKIGKRLVAPMLMKYGTDAQKAHLPQILMGNEFFCQGFSEPDAGSDLAAVRTFAARDGDSFRLSGQKVWTSYAMHFDYCLVLARTDREAPKHHGLSLFLVPLDADGVEVRPIRQINRQAEFAEVWFEDVTVPADDLLGPLNGGWAVTRSVLQFERGVEQAFSRFVEARAGADAVLSQLTLADHDERVASAADVAMMQAEVLAGPLNALRLLAGQLSGGAPDDLSSVLKLQHSEAWSRWSAQVLAMAGRDADRLDDIESAYLDYLDARALTIAGGTSEIQRGVIARRSLGL